LRRVCSSKQARLSSPFSRPHFLFVDGYFASIGKYLQKENGKSIDSRKLVPESNYVVAVGPWTIKID